MVREANGGRNGELEGERGAGRYVKAYRDVMEKDPETSLLEDEETLEFPQRVRVDLAKWKGL